MINGKFNLFTIFLVITLLTVSFASLGQNDYPNRPIKLIVPWSPGGGSDTLMRITAKHAEKYLGASVAVVNKPGASGTVGLEEALKAEPDGYTLAMVHEGLPTAYQLDVTDINYDDFVPIALMTYSPQYLVVHNNAPWNTLREFLDYAKENSVSVGATMGGIVYFWMTGLEDVTNVKFNYVGYEGTGERVKALLGKHIEAIPADWASVGEYVKAGDLKLLAAMTEERLSTTPTVKTAEEYGVDLNFEWSVNRGWVGLPGMDEEKVEVIEEALKKTANDPEYIEAVRKAGGLVKFRGQKGFKDLFSNLNEQLAKLAEETK